LTRQYLVAQKRILNQWIIPDPPEVENFKNRQKQKQQAQQQQQPQQQQAATKDEL
jgi:hypothetical protein